MSDPIYRLIHNATNVISLTPAAGTTCPPKGQTVFDGTQSECQVQITALNLTPLPDPTFVSAKTAKTKALSTALNVALLKLFQSAPIQAQLTYSNLAGPNGSLTALIVAGQPALAADALTGMINDELVPGKYAPLIQSAITMIANLETNFNEINTATTVDAINAVVVPTSDSLVPKQTGS